MDNVQRESELKEGVEPKVISDRGSGRTFVLLFDEAKFKELADHLSLKLAEKSRVLIVQLPEITDLNWNSIYQQFCELLGTLKIRSCSIVSFGSAIAVSASFGLESPKALRTMALIDSPCRSHPGIVGRAIDKIERSLPLGLPLRKLSKAFDVRPHLHRLRSPMLVVTLRHASDFIRNQANLIATLAPTAWREHLENASEQDEMEILSKILLDFQDVPARCPQKNVSNNAASIAQ